jgi:hypothetical protein
MNVSSLIALLEGVDNQYREVILEVEDQPGTSYGIDELEERNDSFLVLKSKATGYRPRTPEWMIPKVSNT